MHIDLGVYLSLGSTNITTNNTEIPITDIGEDVGIGRPSLICHTDLAACCRPDETMAKGTGRWCYPNGDRVPGISGLNSAFLPFVSMRNVQSIELVRRESVNPPPLSPTGCYCCIIPTNGGEVVTFCANLGEYSWAIYSYIYIHNHHPVVCLSLPALNNGIVSYSDPTLGLNTVATYTCESESGYTLNGNTTRTCETDGMWSGSATTCEGELTDAHVLNYIFAPPQWLVLYYLWRMETLYMRMKADVLVLALLTAVTWDTVLRESQ